MNIWGPCVVCNNPLGEADYAAQNVVAAVGPEGTVVMCVASALAAIVQVLRIDPAVAFRQ